VEEVSH
jgi:replication factor C subunit 2/4